MADGKRRTISVVILAIVLVWMMLHLVLHRPTRAPKYVAHRGAAGIAPENSLAAIHAGIESSAVMIEVDVQRSFDGILLLYHDATVPGFGAVGETLYQNIRGKGDAGESVPTLDEALALFASEAAPEQILLLEGKAPDKYPGIAAEIIAAVDAHGLRDQVLIKSFDHDWLREVHTLAPDAALGSIHFYPFNIPHIDGMANASMNWICVIVDPTLISRAHAKSLEVSVWTIDWQPLADVMFWLGADYVTTNRPDRLRTR
jgi:glycerophosphoryl diester phosphodiesterase